MIEACKLNSDYSTRSFMILGFLVWFRYNLLVFESMGPTGQKSAATSLDA